MEIEINNKKCRTNSINTYNKLECYLDSNPISENASEYKVRESLLTFVQDYLRTKEWILYDGNIVWNVERLMKQFRTFIKYYDYEHFPNYLYEFFHLQCGTIAHFNKIGWLVKYPNLSSLKDLFKKNEYGKEVKDYPPDWHYDARLATDTMSKILFSRE